MVARVVTNSMKIKHIKPDYHSIYVGQRGRFVDDMAADCTHTNTFHFHCHIVMGVLATHNHLCIYSIGGGISGKHDLEFRWNFATGNSTLAASRLLRRIYWLYDRMGWQLKYNEYTIFLPAGTDSLYFWLYRPEITKLLYLATLFVIRHIFIYILHCHFWYWLRCYVLFCREMPAPIAHADNGKMNHAPSTIICSRSRQDKPVLALMKSPIRREASVFSIIRYRLMIFLFTGARGNVLARQKSNILNNCQARYREVATPDKHASRAWLAGVGRRFRFWLHAFGRDFWLSHAIVISPHAFDAAYRFQ